MSKKDWRLAGDALALAALLNRIFGVFGQYMTAWLSLGSATCGVLAAR
ncbi:MAG: hypothetical protein JWO67_7081 [Streptosporangiaceae bacterium]|nr:hypothetical protein [Streptosporangiaceae bacterium]